MSVVRDGLTNALPEAVEQNSQLRDFGLGVIDLVMCQVD